MLAGRRLAGAFDFESRDDSAFADCDTVSAEQFVCEAAFNLQVTLTAFRRVRPAWLNPAGGGVTWYVAEVVDCHK